MKSKVLTAAVLSALALGLGTASTVHAQMLFTTSSDFTGWTPPTGGSSTSTVAFDSDSATVNGAGNDPGNNGATLGAGQTSPGGALQITWGSGSGNYTTVAGAPGEAFNTAFMSAIDPGSTAAYQAPAYGPGATVAYSGTIQMVYTIPDNNAASGGYFQLGLDLSYPADGYYQTFFPSSTTQIGTALNGQAIELATIPYTITGSASNNLTGFGFLIAYNSNYAPTQPFFVDSIQTLAAPEPASIGMASAGAGLLLMRRRRRLA